MKYLIQVIVIYCVVQLMTGCVKSDDGDYDPPKIQQIEPDGMISATDTIQILFNEDIDTGTFSLEPGAGAFNWEIKSPRKILIFGTDQKFGRWHFTLGQNIQTTITNLKDTRGNRALDIPLDIDFYPWYDADVFDIEYAQGDTLMMNSSTDHWRNGYALDSLLISEGVIEGTLNLRDGDDLDYKIIFLEPQDVLNLKLECDRQTNFDVRLIGPFATGTFEEKINSVENDIKNIPELTVYKHTSGSSGVVQAEITIQFEVHGPMIVDGENNISSSDPGVYIIRIEQVTNEDTGFYHLETSLHKFL